MIQGNVLKCVADADKVEFMHTPVTLTPIPFPVHLFAQGLAHETCMGLFYSKLVNQNQIIRQITEPLDNEFVRRLLAVSDRAHKS